jgi:hypothetical protein
MRLFRQRQPRQPPERRHAGLEGARRVARRAVAGWCVGDQRHGRRSPPTRPGPTGRPAPCWHQARQALLSRWPPTSPSASAATDSAPHGTSAASAAAAEALPARGFYEQLALEELGQRIDRAAERARAADRRGKGRRPRQPRPEPCATPSSIGLRSEGVREWNYTTNLHTSPAAWRPRAAGRRRPCLPARGVGPLHQHQRAHRTVMT